MTLELILQMLLAFGAVLALMGLLALAARRFGVRSRLGAHSALSVQASLSLGSREKLVVVNYAGRDYLLGVTASQITAIDAAPGADGKPALSAVEQQA